MSQTVKKKVNNTETAKGQFVFQKINYQLFILAIVVVAIGFILMMGTEDIYSFTKITLAPLVVAVDARDGWVWLLALT